MTARFPKGMQLDPRELQAARKRGHNSRRAARLRRTSKRALRLIQREAISDQ